MNHALMHVRAVTLAKFWQQSPDLNEQGFVFLDFDLGASLRLAFELSPFVQLKNQRQEVLNVEIKVRINLKVLFYDRKHP